MRLQVHVFFITLAVAFLVYVFYTGREAEILEQKQGDVHIIVASASLGLNCHATDLTPTQEAGTGRALGDFKDVKEGLPKAETIQNNVLDAVKYLCEGKPQCTVKADPTMLGLVPAGSCARALTIEYRCFAFDKPWQVSARSGSSVTIDCVRQTENTPGGSLPAPNTPEN